MYVHHFFPSLTIFGSAIVDTTIVFLLCLKHCVFVFVFQSGLDVFSASGDLGCKSCDCHMLGSVSSECNTDTGQCQCKESVVGRRCDQCAERFAGLDELGCVGKGD